MRTQTHYLNPNQRLSTIAQSPVVYQNSHIQTSQNLPSYHHQAIQSNSHLKYSRLQDHNTYIHTDKLYDPLRNTLLHPQIITKKYTQIPQATRHSYVSQKFKVLSPQEVEIIKRNTYIPQNVELSQTDHFYKVKDTQFVAVNTEQRVLGGSITPRELEKLKQQGVKRSMVVYDLKQRIEQVDPVTTYVPRPIEPNTANKVKEYKYNLYSMIDEPVNWVREFGCKGANWCTANEIIAGKNEPQSLKWLQ